MSIIYDSVGYTGYSYIEQPIIYAQIYTTIYDDTVSLMVNEPDLTEENENEFYLERIGYVP